MVISVKDRFDRLEEGLKNEYAMLVWTAGVGRFGNRWSLAVVPVGTPRAARFADQVDTVYTAVLEWKRSEWLRRGNNNRTGRWEQKVLLDLRERGVAR